MPHTLRRLRLMGFLVGAISLMSLPGAATEIFHPILPLPAELAFAEPLVSERSTADQRRAAADYLLKLVRGTSDHGVLDTYTVPNVNFALDFVMPPMRGQNVTSILLSTSGSDEFVIVGAHYDSEPGSPGANDNGTGVWAVLKSLEALAALDERRPNFMFIFFDQEEEASVGSAFAVRQLVESDINIRAMHNVDLMGYDGDGDRVFDVDAPSPRLQNLYAKSAKRLGITVNFVTFNSSDHISFRDAGFEATCLGEEISGGDMTPHIHKPTDVIANVDPEYTALGTALLIDMLTQEAKE